MFIRIENLKIHYKVIGCGDPVLLLHGWGGNLEHFSWLQKLLKNQFTIYTVDLPGFGLSSPPKKIWGSTEYANLIATFINSTKIVSPILIGHSFGGKIIIKLVTSNLIKAKKIVLISSAGVRLKKSFKINLMIYSFKFLKNLVQLPIIKNIFGSKFELYRKKFGSNDYRNANGIMRAILVNSINEDLTALLPHIEAPTLLLWGDMDPSTPIRAGHIMKQLIPRSELKIFPGSGHFPFLDNYEKVIIELKKFLRP